MFVEWIVLTHPLISLPVVPHNLSPSVITDAHLSFLTFCLQLIPHQSDLCLITLLTVLRYWLPLCYLWVDSNFFVAASGGREIEDAAHLTEVTRNVLCDVSCHSLLSPHSNVSKRVRRVNTASWTFGLFILVTRVPAVLMKFPGVRFKFSLKFRPQNLRPFYT